MRNHLRGGTIEDPRLIEWKTGRSTIKDFDTRLHDLRKYGFSFLTALLTAEAILIPAAAAAAVQSVGVPSFIKLGVFVVTLLLILALRLMDRYYVLFIKAIVDRTLILERVLNFELTETISQRHRDEKFRMSIIGLYISFSVAVGVLGTFTLLPDLPLIIWQIGITAIVVLLIALIEGLNLLYGERGRLDWIVGCTECSQGDLVRITATNLNKRKTEIVLDQGVVWAVRTQDGKKVHEEKTSAPIPIYPQDSYTWEWDTSKVPEDIYRLFPTPGPGTRPLLRKIVVGPKKPPPVAPTKV